MAGESVIGALRVVIGADSAALDKGLSDARGSLQQFGADVARAGAVIGVALTAAFAAVSFGINGALDKMEGFAKQSQKIGIPVDQLSALSLAANVADVSMDQLQTGLGKLSKAMVEAAAKPTSEAANAFRALGVQVTGSNGQLRPVIDVTTSIAGKFENLKDGAGKTAVSMALFGKSGAELIPLLNMGAGGLQEMMANAQKFGIVIDSQTAKAADHFRDSLKMLGAAKDGIIIKLTAFLLPAMQAFADRMLANASNADKQSQKLSFLKTVFEGVARAVLLVVDNFGALLKITLVFIGVEIVSAVAGMIVAFVNLARALQAVGLMTAAVEAIRAITMKGWLLLVGLIVLATGQFENFAAAIKMVGEKISSALPEDTGKTFSKILEALGFDLKALTQDLTNFGNGTRNAGKGQGDLNYSLLAGKTAVDNFLASTQKQIAAQQAEVTTAGMAAGAKEKLKVMLEALTIASSNNLPVTEAMRAKIAETALAAEQMALKLQGAQLIQQNLTPLQAYTQEINNSTLAMQAAGATQEQLARNAQTVADKFGLSATAIGTSIAGTMGSLSQLTGTFAKENKTMGVLSKAFGIGQAIINTQIAITKALATLPPPASYAAVAFAIAQGAAAIATISAQKFAMGGAFRVPGGSGGGDRVPVSFMAEPGELVEVTSNRANGYKPDRAGGGVTTVKVLAPDITRDYLGALIKGINLAVKDGYRLELSPV